MFTWQTRYRDPCMSSVGVGVEKSEENEERGEKKRERSDERARTSGGAPARARLGEWGQTTTTTLRRALSSFCPRAPNTPHHCIASPPRLSKPQSCVVLGARDYCRSPVHSHSILNPVRTAEEPLLSSRKAFQTRRSTFSTRLFVARAPGRLFQVLVRAAAVVGNSAGSVHQVITQHDRHPLLRHVLPRHRTH